MNKLNVSFVLDDIGEEGYLNVNYTSGAIFMYGTSRTVIDFVSGVKINARSSLQIQNLWHSPIVSAS